MKLILIDPDSLTQSMNRLKETAVRCELVMQLIDCSCCDSLDRPFFHYFIMKGCWVQP